MDRKQLVLLRLKPKTKALGFNLKELKGIAANIADNLTSEEEASEEDIKAEIDNKIEAIIPYLSYGQSQANRLLDEWKKKNPHNEEAEDQDEEAEDQDEEANHNRGKKSTKNRREREDDVPGWVKGLQQTVETLTSEIALLKGEKVTDARRSKLETLLKDTGTFGTHTLKSFAKMKFEDNDEFEEFYSEVENDLNAYNQERANAGLSKMGVPPTAGGGKHEEKLITDAEIDAIVDSL